MEWLQSLYPRVKEHLLEAVPEYWPELREIYSVLLKDKLPTEVALPLAACRAVGGEAKDAVPLTTSLLSIAISMRILDDFQDKDKSNALWEQIGAPRAINFSAATQTLSHEILRSANYPTEVFKRVNKSMLHAILRLFAGQARDLSVAKKYDFKSYWKTMEMKSASAYSLACKAGALVALDNQEMVNACSNYGYHLGMAMQILNDFESIWRPNKLTDLENNKVTLPLLYGLSFEHPHRDRLRTLTKTTDLGEHSAEITDILNEAGTKKFMIWLALQERESAINALIHCPSNEGKLALEHYITGMFADIDDLLMPNPIP